MSINRILLSLPSRTEGTLLFDIREYVKDSLYSPKSNIKNIDIVKSKKSEDIAVTMWLERNGQCLETNNFEDLSDTEQDEMNVLFGQLWAYWSGWTNRNNYPF